MNPLRRASAPYSDGTILACRLAHGDSCPLFNNSDIELTNMKKTISRKANLSLPPPPLDAESHIPFSAQLFVTLQLWNNPEQDHIVREL